MNYFYNVIDKRLEDAVKELCKHVPEIVQENHEWEALVKIAELNFNSSKEDKINFQSQCWILSKGQRILTDNYEKLSAEDLSFAFYVSMIRISDWGITKYLLKNMPTKLVEQYLIEELPNIGVIQHVDHFKSISKRKDEWGQYPANWLEKAYGRNKNNG